MLRLIKWTVLGIICAALVVMGVANMAPVDLRLFPSGIVDQEFTISGVPLSAVILVAILLGVVIGELFEWIRESKHRRRAASHAREILRLQGEVRMLKRRLGDKDDLPKIAAQ